MLTKSDLENNLERIHDWTKAVDQKVGIFLAFQGIVLTILFLKVFSWFIANFSKFTCTEELIFFAGVAFVGISLYKSISAITPRLGELSEDEKEKRSVTFFQHIASFTSRDFRHRVRSITAEEYEDDLINQIYISAGIAKRKHMEFKYAITFFFPGIFFLAISFLMFRFL